MGGHGVFIQHEGDGLSGLDGVRIHLFYIDKGAGVVSRLHGAGKHRKHLQTHHPSAYQQQSQQHHQTHQHGGKDVPDLLNGFVHAHFLLAGEGTKKPALMAIGILSLIQSIFKTFILFCNGFSKYSGISHKIQELSDNRLWVLVVPKDVYYFFNIYERAAAEKKRPANRTLLPLGWIRTSGG